jgi:hypothetical protein
MCRWMAPEARPATRGRVCAGSSLAGSEARPPGASWPAVSPPRPGCLQLQTGQEAKRNAFGAVTSPTRQAAARLTGFEDSNSSANVGINSKAAGHSAYLFGNNNNLVLLNIGGNGHSVPATVPVSAPLPPRITDPGGFVCSPAHHSRESMGNRSLGTAGVNPQPSSVVPSSRDCSSSLLVALAVEGVW